jgi:hypothetical protein
LHITNERTISPFAVSIGVDTRLQNSATARVNDENSYSVTVGLKTIGRFGYQICADVGSPKSKRQKPSSFPEKKIPTGREWRRWAKI